MAEIETGETRIQHRACVDPGCDFQMGIKVNKNRKCYAYCDCGAHVRFNKATSRAMIEAYHGRAVRGKKRNALVKPDQAPKPANENTEPQQQEGGRDDHWLFG